MNIEKVLRFCEEMQMLTPGKWFNGEFVIPKIGFLALRAQLLIENGQVAEAKSVITELVNTPADILLASRLKGLVDIST